MGLFNNILKGFSSNDKKEIYSYETVEQIKSIAIPKYSDNKGISSPVNNIEYILQRKATEFKKNGRMDLAIECLRKSNEIFPHSNFSWQKKDYLRLVEFLKDDNQFDMAREEEGKINGYFNNQLPVHEQHIARQKEVSKRFGSGYVMAINNVNQRPCCGKCAKYRNRVYDTSGKDKRFPFYSEEVQKSCCLDTWSYILNVTLLEDSKGKVVKNVIDYSNRPYIDDRTPAEKKRYEEYRVHCQEKEKDEREKEMDKKEYDILREFLPESAPKSFNGYRKMKNTKSDNFYKLVDSAKLKGIDIEVR